MLLRFRYTTKMSTSTPLFLLLVGALIPSVNCLTDPAVPASFFPFGTDEGDNIVPVGDDLSSPGVSIPTGFPFLYGNRSSVYVSTQVQSCNLKFCMQKTTDVKNIFYVFLSRARLFTFFNFFYFANDFYF